MLESAYCKYNLIFHQKAVTSRDVMNSKETYFIKIWDSQNPNIVGIGECALFRGLSYEDSDDYELILANTCRNISNYNSSDYREYSSIVFGVETAIRDLSNNGKRVIFPSEWINGNNDIKINGLIWMGSFEQMYNRINEKLHAGFHCLKLKIGGIDFEKEIELIRYIRSKFTANILELRLDANGAFSTNDALIKLKELSKYSIHSIEQPIKSGQWELMAELCLNTPIPIALDEELIGINDIYQKELLLKEIRPQYIILKPALCGGFSGADEWISLANKFNIGWWATSALESNIGLNAIAQWISTYKISLPQGLGTGQLYSNNFSSPLVQERDVLHYNQIQQWHIPTLNWIEP
ncbi:MAG: o-succinylbenzoate synthase [Muribaculaceae bacterium]|nr:o-succinylbenzoate synthase [Muribaculaceae bacterium]